MPGPIIAKPTLPGWMDPANASVFDVPGQGMLRKVVGLLGLDDPNQVMAFGTPLETGAATGGVLEALAQKFPRFANAIKAYHGSPHDFEEFKTSAIGTGEGAQAYGHGLYFAENPAVAREYKDALGSVVPAFDKTPVRTGYEQVAHDILSDATSLDHALRLADEVSAPQGLDAKAVKRVITENYGKTPGTVHTGKMYEVAIGAHPDQFLDWDKPITEQPSVIDTLKRRGYITADDPKYPGRLEFSGKLGGGWVEGTTGEDLLHSLQETHGDVGASLTLNKAGIPGIKYLDQGSRAAGEGSRNFVVFDDATVAILRKYGILPPVAGAALGSQRQDKE